MTVEKSSETGGADKPPGTHPQSSSNGQHGHTSSGGNGNGHGNGNGNGHRRKKPAIRKDLARRTLGPVPDLERHLPPDWWRHLFNSVYLKTDGDVVENDENTRREVDLAVRTAGIREDDRVLDLCCGQGRHSIELARRGFKNVAGVDRSRYLVRLAKKRARALNLPVRFSEGDARKYRPPKGESFFCVMLLGNSFGYFNVQKDDAEVMKAVRRSLEPNGVVVLDITDGQWMRENFQPRSWEWIDERHLVCRERSLSSDGDRIITREVVVNSELGVIADQFYAERLYSLDRLTSLLEQHGFTMVVNHGSIEAESDRGQDLGMMAHRIWITARAPKFAVPMARKESTKVTVIMGDPKLPDLVKKQGRFNPEDLDTIQKLRSGLSEIEGYEYRFLDEHPTFLEAIRHDPPEFVLNLCDEGYMNDPFKELHIPALLEMYGIPYTGAGPACLGLCYNKSLVRSIADAVDIPVPLESYCGPDDLAATLPCDFPALVKPCCADSSMGLTKDGVVHDMGELHAYVRWLREKYGRISFLIQEFLTGSEYTVGIIGNPGLSCRTLPILEVDYSSLDPNLPKILGYESKWDPDSPYWTQIKYKEAQLDSDVKRQLQDYSSTLFERLGCRDYARFDFRCDNQGTVKLLEVNPNPGWCWDGKFNIMAGFGGLKYADFLRLILEAAQERVALSRENSTASTTGSHVGGATSASPTTGTAVAVRQ